MSCYVNFFIRSPKDEFLSLGSFSRNTAEYGCANELALPYEKIRLLTTSSIKSMRQTAMDIVGDIRESIKKCNDEISIVKGMEGTVGEKLENIREINNEIADLVEDDKRYSQAYGYFNSLIAIDCEYENPVIYAGIECDEPTVDDIVE